MNSRLDAIIKNIENDACAVLAFRGGQIDYTNEACYSIFEGLDLSGYELEYLLGDEVAEIVLSNPDSDGGYVFGRWEMLGRRGSMRVICTSDMVILIFSPIDRGEQRRVLSGYKQYVRRLTKLYEDAQFELVGGEGERFEYLSQLDFPLTRSDIQELRVQRRREQVNMLERFFMRDPIHGDYLDIVELCNRTLTGCAEILNANSERVKIGSTSRRELKRVFARDELERMVACLLTGSLALCGEESIEVTVEISPEGLRIDISSKAKGFNDEAISRAVHLSSDIQAFAETGHGLELLLVSEIAERYFGSVHFSRIDGVGRLSTFVAPDYHGIEGELYDARVIADGKIPQYIIELSEMI